MAADVREGDVIDVSYTNDVNETKQTFRAFVTDTEDGYMTEGEADGFKAIRFSDEAEVGVQPGEWICKFGFKQDFFGHEAEVEIVLEARGAR